MQPSSLSDKDLPGIKTFFCLDYKARISTSLFIFVTFSSIDSGDAWGARAPQKFWGSVYWSTASTSGFEKLSMALTLVG